MIRFEIRDRVALATIDRTERRNALNAELCDVLHDHLNGIDIDAVGAIVITGEGTAFCSGADLGRPAATAAGSSTVAATRSGPPSIGSSRRSSSTRSPSSPR